MKVQINSGLSLWLDEKWGSGHKEYFFSKAKEVLKRNQWDE